MAFLLERSRSFDVDAAADGARILGMSHGAIADDPTVAAKPSPPVEGRGTVSPVAQPPSGTVTFLFTDIEGSTRRWEDDAGSMDEALDRHDAILREVVERHHGYVFATGSDGFAVAFARAGEAVRAAVAVQRVLQEESLLPVRMGVHTGEAVERDGDYFGPAVNRAARLKAIGHGGQILVSSATERLLSGVELRDLGAHRLRDLSTPERVFQLCVPGLKVEFAPLRSLDALPGNLPVQLTSFIGRDEEVKALLELLDDHRSVPPRDPAAASGVKPVGSAPRSSSRVAARRRLRRRLRSR